ncbi:MAG: ankyrin repeat domain-containing protein [Longimicrobiales bacterium]
MANDDAPTADFERAADAVVDGDLPTLTALLDRWPTLVAAHSDRPHRGTLLMYAASNGVEDERQRVPANAVSVADLLIARGADINQICDVYGGGPGATPLVGLVTSIHPVEAGLMEELVRAYARSGQSLDGPDGGGLPLLFAFLHRNTQAAETLAECGATVMSAPAAAGLGRLHLVREMVELGPPPTADGSGYAALEWVSQDGETAAQFACFLGALAGRVEVVRFLADAGVDVSAPIHQGRTALHEACWGGHLDVVEVLVGGGADTEAVDELFNATPGGWAAHAGHEDIVAFLARKD